MASKFDFVEELDVQPFDEARLSIMAHKPNRMECWNPMRIQSYIAQSQSLSRLVIGHNLRKELDGMNNLNISAFNWFWNNKHYFPLEWCGRKNGRPIFTFFWGTILKTADGRGCVPCMWWENGLKRGYRLLDSKFDANSPAAQYAA